MDLFAKVPLEVIRYILYGLRAVDIVNLSRVNKRFHQICEDNKIWKPLCEVKGENILLNAYSAFVAGSLIANVYFKKTKIRTLSGNRFTENPKVCFHSFFLLVRCELENILHSCHRKRSNNPYY